MKNEFNKYFDFDLKTPCIIFRKQSDMSIDNKNSYAIIEDKDQILTFDIQDDENFFKKIRIQTNVKSIKRNFNNLNENKLDSKEKGKNIFEIMKQDFEKNNLNIHRNYSKFTVESIFLSKPAYTHEIQSKNNSIINLLKKDNISIEKQLLNQTNLKNKNITKSKHSENNIKIVNTENNIKIDRNKRINKKQSFCNNFFKENQITDRNIKNIINSERVQEDKKTSVYNNFNFSITINLNNVDNSKNKSKNYSKESYEDDINFKNPNTINSSKRDITNKKGFNKIFKVNSFHSKKPSKIKNVFYNLEKNYKIKIFDKINKNMFQSNNKKDCNLNKTHYLSDCNCNSKIIKIKYEKDKVINDVKTSNRSKDNFKEHKSKDDLLKNYKKKFGLISEEDFNSNLNLIKNDNIKYAFKNYLNNPFQFSKRGSGSVDKIAGITNNTKIGAEKIFKEIIQNIEKTIEKSCINSINQLTLDNKKNFKQDCEKLIIAKSNEDNKGLDSVRNYSNLLNECFICEISLTADEIFGSLNCDHYFCFFCGKIFFENKIEQNDFFFKCLRYKCDKLIHLRIVKRCISEQHYKSLIKKVLLYNKEDSDTLINNYINNQYPISNQEIDINEEDKINKLNLVLMRNNNSEKISTLINEGKINYLKEKEDKLKLIKKDIGKKYSFPYLIEFHSLNSFFELNKNKLIYCGHCNEPALFDRYGKHITKCLNCLLIKCKYCLKEIDENHFKLSGFNYCKVFYRREIKLKYENCKTERSKYAYYSTHFFLNIISYLLFVCYIFFMIKNFFYFLIFPEENIKKMRIQFKIKSSLSHYIIKKNENEEIDKFRNNFKTFKNDKVKTLQEEKNTLNAKNFLSSYKEIKSKEEYSSIKHNYKSYEFHNSKNMVDLVLINEKEKNNINIKNSLIKINKVRKSFDKNPNKKKMHKSFVSLFFNLIKFLFKKFVYYLFLCNFCFVYLFSIILFIPFYPIVFNLFSIFE